MRVAGISGEQSLVGDSDLERKYSRLSQDNASARLLAFSSMCSALNQK